MDASNESSRRLSHNGRLMREIVDRLREYSLEEVKLICDKYRRRHGRFFSGRRRRRDVPGGAPAVPGDAPGASGEAGPGPAGDDDGGPL